MTDFQKANNLDKTEQTLYSPNSDIRRKSRHKIYEEEHSINKDWMDAVNQDSGNNPFKKGNRKGLSVFSKVFIGAFLFFLCALGYALYMFYFKNSPDLNNVDITINSPVSVAAGEQFNYDIVISNNNSIKMETVDLVVEYPQGTRDGKDVSVDMPRERTDIGSIDAGSYHKETRSVFLFGETGETKEITVGIVYRAPNSNALFEKKKVFDIVLKSTPIRMDVSSIKEVTSGQDLSFDVEITSNSNETINNLLIKGEYPFGFVFDSSDSPDQIDNNTWLIKEISPQQVITFKVSGKLQGQNKEDRSFKFYAGLLDPKKEKEIGVLFTSAIKTIAVSRPFLEVDLSIDKDNSSVINLSPGRNYQANVIYKNNTNDPLKDVNVVLQLNGAMLNENAVQVSKGFYSSVDNTITWDKTTNSEFENLGVGRSGILSFSFGEKEVGLDKTVFTNPEISINAKVKGFRYSEKNVPEEITNEIFKTLRFDTNIGVIGDSLFYEGPFTNTGQIPPKADITNTYTIMLTVSNSANQLSNGKLEMTLPNYVTFNSDKIWPDGADIQYVPRERKIVWNIGEMKENTGYAEDPAAAAFQVSMIPSISQNGTEPILINALKFTGVDMFTGRPIQRNVGVITTEIRDRKNYFDGKVTQ